MRSITPLRAFFLTLVSLGVLANDVDDSWRSYGADPGGRRFSPHSQINAGNVSALEPAWIYRTGDVSDGSKFPGRSTFKATPVLFQDRLYISTPFNRVIALDAATGQLVWAFDPQVDFSQKYAEMFTSRGVSVWTDETANVDRSCSARVILGTLDARLIVMDAYSGRPCEDFGTHGEVSLAVGIKNFRHQEYSVTSPASVIGDIVVVGSSIGDNGAVELDHGNIRGFDVRSGRLLWSWDPIPREQGMPGWESWDRRGGRLTGAANAWSVISADPPRGLVYVPTTSPSPDFYGGIRPGHNLYANSVVALRATTGQMVWHFQTVHHDLWDYDLAAQPLLTNIVSSNSSQDVVVQATKMGHLFVLDRDTGRPVHPVVERPVPQSDVPGEYSSATQPYPVMPPPLHDLHATIDDIWGYSSEHETYCRERLGQLRNEGIYTPPSLRGTLVYPGNPGGVNWGSMAVHEGKRIALTILKRWPTVVTLIPRADFRRRVVAERGGPLRAQFTEQAGTPYGMKRHGFFNPETKLPCLKGPWGTLVAVDLDNGQKRWEAPVGIWPGLENHPEASQWGTIPAGGPIVTQGGLVFAATDDEPRMFAYDLQSGAQVWKADLPAAAQATPMTYMSNGRQFVAIAAGGLVPGSDQPGDYVIAYALRNP